MHNIYIGYSSTKSSSEIISYFDIDPDHDFGLSKFEQNFGGGYIGPECFEVYDRNDYPNYFSLETIVTLFPFRAEPILLEQINFSSAQCIFYIETDQIKHTEHDDIIILGNMLLEKYDFE